MKITLNMTDPSEHAGVVTNMAPGESPCDGWRVGGLNACEHHGVGVLFVVAPDSSIESKADLKRCVTEAIRDLHRNVMRIIDNSPAFGGLSSGQDNTLN